jgi:hypothetical protein
LPDAALVPQVRASWPPRSSASPTSAGLIVSSERTCRGMRTGSLKLSSQHWSDWATGLRLEYSARPASEEVTDESASSSWPTARVARGAYTRDQGDPEKPRLSLEGVAEQWMTPNVPNGGRAAHHAEITGKTATHNGKKVQIGLEHQARQWPTPGAGSDNSLRGGAQDPAVRRAGGHQVNLQDMACHWPTPCAVDRPRSPATMAKCAAFRKRNANQNTVPLYLGEVALSFPSSAQGQAMHAGPKSSAERRTLNPLFVEWLMGWPIGWTDCASAVTGFTLWQQDMRGLLSTLCSRKPRQATLL